MSCYPELTTCQVLIYICTTYDINKALKTRRNVTATVVRDLVPEFLAHIVLIVAGKNLLLHRFVSAVGTERRIAGQTAHTSHGNG